MRSLSLILLAIILMISNLSIAFAVDPVDTGSDMAAFVPEYEQINATQPVLLNTTIGTGLSSFSFILTWLNATSSLEATLTSPSGTKIDSNAQLPIIYGTNKTMIYFILPGPEAGKWTAVITAKNAPDVGESFLALFNTDSMDESTEQGPFDDEINPSDLENISGECENCTEQS